MSISDRPDLNVFKISGISDADSGDTSETCSLDVPLSKTVRLWVLRLLVTCCGLRPFVRSMGFSNRGLAHALGLARDDMHDANADTSGVDEEIFDEQAAFAEIYRQKSELEAAAFSLSDDRNALDVNIGRVREFLGLSEAEAKVLHFAISLHSVYAMEAAAEIVKTFCRSRSLFVTIEDVLCVPQGELRQMLGEGSLLVRTGLLRVSMRGDLDDKIAPVSGKFARQISEAICNPETLFEERVRFSKKMPPPRADFEHIGKTLNVGLAYLRTAGVARQERAHVLIRGHDNNCQQDLGRLLAGELGVQLLEICAQNDDDIVSGYYLAQAVCRKRPALIMMSFNPDIADRIFADECDAPCHAPTLWLAGSDSSEHAKLFDDGDKGPELLGRMNLVLHAKAPSPEIRTCWLEQYCGGLLHEAVMRQFSENPLITRHIVMQAAAAQKAASNGESVEEQARTLEHILGSFVQSREGGGVAKYESVPELPDVYDACFINTDGDVEKIIEGIQRTQSARVCLYGVSGTGKTAFCHYLASRLGKTLQVERCSDIMSKYVGETERNIAKIFERAKHAGNVLLMDEVDSFIQNRAMATRTWEVTCINEMLSQLESFDGLFLASTNRITSLDRAVLRRFDLKIRFDPLRAEQAWGLLLRQLEHAGVAAPADAAETEMLKAKLADLRELTPGDFATVSRRARFYPLPDAAAWIDALTAECRLKMM